MPDSLTILSPASRGRRAEHGRAAAASLAARDVTAVAVTWVDNSGITRVKAVPRDRLPHAAAWGIGASPVFDTFLLDDSTVTGRYSGGPVGDLRLYPDLDRLTVLAAQPGWAWAPADRYDQEGAVHPADARGLARREAARLAGRGLRLRAAYEIEWCISTGGGDQFDPAVQGPAYGMARLVEQSGYLQAILRALAAQGVAVDQIHPEYAAGQFELSVAPGDPVSAADDLVLVRETIRAVSLAHGLRPSFAPKVVAGSVGNGGHIHLSLWRDGENLMSSGTGHYGLTAAGESFMAGILSRLPALLAIGAPSVGSYLRLIPSHWAGAFACWGLENREAAVRFVTGSAGERGTAANVEIKCVDQSANPYLLVAALIAAGRAGLDAAATLPDPVDVDPATMDASSLAERGIAALPSNLPEAVAAFVADPVFSAAFGPDTVDTIATVRHGEAALFEGASPDEIAERSRWRY